ncbi:MAG: hypothetical protein L6R40_001617 [Gallowayella cf. fulva]|nr:MAG: hypothetical protein L6R40_001617 [Xanthomendoza cf. fulva]
MGFPAHLLPGAAVLPNSARNKNSTDELRLPLDPNHTPNLRTQVHLDPTRAIAPAGGKLVMSLATEIYWYWRDTANAAITEIAQKARPPFENFVYTEAPSQVPGTVLTPYKLGIACAWILDSIVKADVWPGYAVAEITAWHGSREFMVGSLSVINQPATKSAPNTKELAESFSLNKTDNSSAVQPKRKASAVGVPDNDIERRWFKCLTGVLLYIVKHNDFGLVTDDLPGPEPGRTSANYKIPCAPESKTIKDKMSISIYAATASHGSRQLMWIRFLEELLMLGSEVALEGRRWDTKGIVRADDRITVLAAFGIKIEGEEHGGDGPSTSDVTRA